MKSINQKLRIITAGVLLFLMYACKTPQISSVQEKVNLPAKFNNQVIADTLIDWRSYFDDPILVALIDTALVNNQEFNITKQEVEIARNEIMAKKGEYMPTVNYKGGMGLEKAARYTNIGAMEATTDIKPEREMPEPLPDFLGGLYASWEVDIWHKMRNARKAAFERYMASNDAVNWMQTNLVAEIAESYYELLALDNELAIVNQNIEIQSDALEIVKLQKLASRVSELGVRRFEAEVLKTKSLQYGILQEIVETENRLRFLTGKYTGAINRQTVDLNNLNLSFASAGLPAGLLSNRPDIKAKERELAAAKIDVEVARLNFYPSLGISANLGLRAFNPLYFSKLPESLLSSLTADLIGPLINKRALTATYLNANAKQTQAVYEYEKVILQAYLEIVNQQSKIENLSKSFDLKSRQVAAMESSIGISSDLFKNARADYMEVLLTQRDALEAKFELVETRKDQLHARVNIYKALGGGWF